MAQPVSVLVYKLKNNYVPYIMHSVHPEYLIFLKHDTGFNSFYILIVL